LEAEAMGVEAEAVDEITASTSLVSTQQFFLMTAQSCKK